MKLNNEKNIKLCQKALYAKQLQYYSKLCDLYSELARLSGPAISPQAVQALYSKILSAASYNNLDCFLQDKPDIYSEEEIRIFKSYAFASTRLKEFTNAAKLLEMAIPDEESSLIYFPAVADYESYMQSTSKSTQAFDTLIKERSNRTIGHHFYLESKKAIEKIDDIDKNHLQSQIFEDKLTPEAFGATIEGFRSTREILDKTDTILERTGEDELLEDYKKEPNLLIESALFVGNKAKNKVKETYTGNKTAVRNTILAVLATGSIGLIAAGVNYGVNTYNYNNLSSRTNIAQGYELYVSPETQAMLSSIRQAIEQCETSSFTPTLEQISDIRNNLDEVIDLVMADLTQKAFLEKHPNYKVLAVDTAYDKTVNQTTTATSELVPEYTCTITYINKAGEEDTVVISDFSSLPFFASDIDTSFDNEYKLDRSVKYNTSVYDDTTTPWNEKSEQIMDILASYKSVLEDTEHLAGTQIIYKDGGILTSPSLKTTIPQKISNKSTNVKVEEMELE